MQEKDLNKIEDKINVLKTQKSELHSAMKLTQEEISRRDIMGIDSTEFKEHLVALDKKLVKVIKDIPKLETQYYTLRRSMDAEQKKKVLADYIEARLRYYSNALDKLNGKQGIKIGMIQPKSNMEAQIGQLARGE